MTVEPIDLRAVAAQVIGLLRDEGTPLDQRVARASSMLDDALIASTPLTPEQRAALDADPSVQAALARLDDDEEYFLADEDGGPSGVRLELEPGAEERPVDDQRLTELGH